jgi:purine-cytosine permease-like protein
MVQDFYLNTDVYPSSNQYIFSYYSMLMVILGADICNDYNQYFKEPISVGQAFYLVFVGILGSVALAVLFGKMSHILQLSN